MSDRAQTVGVRGCISNPRLHLCVTVCTLLVAGGWVFAEGSRPARSTIPALQETPVRAVPRIPADARREREVQSGGLARLLDRVRRARLPLRDRDGARIRLRAQESAEDAAASGAGADRRGSARTAPTSMARTTSSPKARRARSQDGERYVLLKPKRKDMLLVDGRMVLNQDGTELLRVEGSCEEPVVLDQPRRRRPRVRAARRRARADLDRTVAKLKFAGTSRMDVQYQYETINGRPVSLGARQLFPSSLSGRR